MMKGTVSRSRDEGRERVRAIRQVLAQLKRWADPRKLPTKKELSAFEQLLVGAEPEIRPLFVFRVWAHQEPSLALARALAKETSRADIERSATIANSFLLDSIVPNVDVLHEAGPVLADFFLPGPRVSIETADGVWESRVSLSWYGRWSSLVQWIYSPRSNPQLVDLRRLDLLWEFELSDPGLEHAGTISDVSALMEICAHFVEPSGFPRENTPKRRLASVLRSEFEKRDLIEPFASIWERVRTRAGRSAIWDQELDPGKKFGSDILYDYGALVIHDMAVDGSLIGKLTDILAEQGMLEGVARSADSVELSRHLHPKMLPRLGYEKGDAIPGYRLRIRTNAEFTDSESARIHLDVVVPCPHPSEPPDKDVPTLLLAPRPDKPYAEIGRAYELNLQTLRRVFHRETETHIWRYTTCGFGAGHGLKKAEDQEGPGLYKCKYLPLKGEGAALVDDAEHDFPAWTGDPLPPVDWP